MQTTATGLLIVLAVGCVSSSPVGTFTAGDGSRIELHVGPDGAIRGHMREGERIAALTSVVRDGDLMTASAVYDDGSRGEIRKALRLEEVETPAGDALRKEIEAAYRLLARAVEEKDFAAFQALRVPEFATIPPDGVPSPGSRMADRARGFLERIQPPIETTNDILRLTTRGDEAIATVRQKFTRQQIIEGQRRTVHSEVTQRETWRRTPEGWKLVFVDDVRDPITLVDGERLR